MTEGWRGPGELEWGRGGRARREGRILKPRGEEERSSPKCRSSQKLSFPGLEWRVEVVEEESMGWELGNWAGDDWLARRFRLNPRSRDRRG